MLLLMLYNSLLAIIIVAVCLVRKRRNHDRVPPSSTEGIEMTLDSSPQYRGKMFLAYLSQLGRVWDIYILIWQ